MDLNKIDDDDTIDDEINKSDLSDDEIEIINNINDDNDGEDFVKDISEEELNVLLDQIDQDWAYIKEGALFPTKEIRYIYNPNVFEEDIRYSNPKNSPQHRPLNFWESFHLISRLSDSVDTNIEYRYDFELNGNLYLDRTWDEMIRVLRPAIDKKGLPHFENLLHQHSISGVVKEIKYQHICGFTEKGWRLPDRYRFKWSNGIQRKYAERISAMTKLNIDHAFAKQSFQNFYKSIKMQFSDEIIAFIHAQTFAFALRNHTKLMPWGGAGLEPGTGKTTLVQKLTNDYWGHIEGVLSPNTLDSPARAGDYFSLCTFPSIIDEAQSLIEKIKDTIKIATTTGTQHQRLNKLRDLAIDQELCMPIFLCYNDHPDMFEDEAFLQRGIFYRILKILNDVEAVAVKNAFIESTKNVPNGYWGKYFYEMTADWDLEKVIEMYESYSYDTPLNGRDDTIFRMHKLGAEVVKYLYDIDLKLDYQKILKQMAETKTIQSNTFMDYLMIQLTHSTDDKKERPKWIDVEVREQTIKGKVCFIYSGANFNELKKVAGIKKMGLEAGATKMGEFLINCKYKSIKLQGNDIKKKTPIKMITIPKESFYALQAQLADLDKIENKDDDKNE